MNLPPRVSRYGFVGLAIAAVVVSALLRMQNLGYVALFLGLGFVAVGITHVVLHWRLSAARPMKWRVVAASVLSHVALISAFLLQWEPGIGGGRPQLTLLEFVHPPQAGGAPTWAESRFSGLEYLALVVVSWVLLLRADRPRLVGRIAVAGNAAVAVALAGMIAAISVSVFAESARADDEAVRIAGGRPPASCGQGQAPPRIREGFRADRAFGEAPVWLWDVASNPKTLSYFPFKARPDDLALHRLGTGLIEEPNQGVYTEWLVDAKFTQTVTARIVEVATGEPVRVTMTGSDGRIAAFPPRSSNAASSVRSYNAAFHITHAGCYVIEANWPGGSWRIPLAAGE